MIFEPTSEMLTALGFSSPQIIVGAVGLLKGNRDRLWGGCNLWVSIDDVNYQFEGLIKGRSCLGTVVGQLPAYGGSNPDNTDTLVVNTRFSEIALPSYPTAAAAAGTSLCILRDLNRFELLSYTNSTLVSANTFALTGLYRGLYGTSAAEFNDGTPFMCLPLGNFFAAPMPPQYVGMTLWIKAQSFNAFQLAMKPLEEILAVQYVVTGPTPAGPQVANFSAARRVAWTRPPPVAQRPFRSLIARR